MDQVSKETLFVITSGEDGTHMEEMSEEILEARLAEGYWGEDGVNHLTKVPDSDKGCWLVTDKLDRTPMLIIRGRIVVPEPVQQVTKWRVP